MYNGKGYVMVTASFPRNKEIEEIDELTGLLTKGAFKQSLINFKADKAVVVFCDIDNLKHFNTVYGHLETDRVIRKVAMFIKQCTRSTDVIGKFGGDEFVMLLRDTTVRDCYARDRKSVV